MLARAFTLGALGLGASRSPAWSRAVAETESSPPLVKPTTGMPSLIKPPGLRKGDKVALINPATAAFVREEIEVAVESLEALDLQVVHGDHYFDRRGYFAGGDEQRAQDINRFFADPSIKALWARGGWGSARVLPHLDYDLMRANPKIVAGFSDVTALLNAIHARTGLVTFHTPFPRRSFVAERLKEVMFEGVAPTWENPKEIADGDTVQTEDRIRTITGGRARGRLLGGNLTVLTAIVGSPYLPDWSGAILFLEDINEAVYRVDRMLTQLSLAGILEQLNGFVFGICSRCPPDTEYGSLTLEEVLADHAAPLGIPAYHGALIGHIRRQFPMPIGIEAELDADRGAIRLLEPAVI